MARSKLKSCLLAILMFSGYAESSGVCELEISAAENSRIFFSKYQIENLTRGDIVDSPVSTYRIDGENIWILATAMQRNAQVHLSHTFTRGDISNPGEELVGVYNQYKLFQESEVPDPEKKGYKWITNTYQTEDGVLALIHTEYTAESDYWAMPCETRSGFETCAPGTSKIGLAWMDTTGGLKDDPKFVYLGHIAGSTSGRAHINVHGTPYLITENEGETYLNFLFHDSNKYEGFGHIAQARAPLDEVLAAARKGELTQWKKYNRGKWEDALTGHSSPVSPSLR